MKPSDIKKIRKEMGLTQREFAKMLELHINTIKSWEYGKRNVPPKQLDRISELEREYFNGIPKIKPSDIRRIIREMNLTQKEFA